LIAVKTLDLPYSNWLSSSSTSLYEISCFFNNTLQAHTPWGWSDRTVKFYKILLYGLLSTAIKTRNHINFSDICKRFTIWANFFKERQVFLVLVFKHQQHFDFLKFHFRLTTRLHWTTVIANTGSAPLSVYQRSVYKK
jgi:hypothetical protein